MLEEDILLVYLDEDYHNLLYDHIYGHAELDYEMLDFVLGQTMEDLMIHLYPNIFCSISACQECSNYKVKVVATSSFFLQYADNRISNVTFENATIFVSANGELGNFRMTGDSHLHTDAEAILYGRMIFNGQASISSGTQIRLDIDSATPSAFGADYCLINDLSYVHNANFFLVDSTDVETGSYLIAPVSTNSIDFVTIKDTGGNVIGVLSENQDVSVRDVRYSLGNYQDYLTIFVSSLAEAVLSGSYLGISFENIAGNNFSVEYSPDDFSSVFRLTITTTAIDTFQTPAGAWQVRVDADAQTSFTAANPGTAPAQLVSDADGNLDVFFAKTNTTWQGKNIAKHAGNLNGWTGTHERATISGKNKIEDIFAGSTDANVLVLTDDTNGDALFLDDIYSTFGNQARLSQIDEIRAGAGDDVVDLTSPKFAYVGDSMTVYGGAGNDTIWANSGSNTLYGDAGNDRLVGGNGNDFITGGAGNDSMHGGGGNDTFCFGGNWGNDTIEQLASGKVILRFESGSLANWNATTQTYTAGSNSVTVTGTSDIELYFGADSTLPAGAFLSASSEKIYEDINSGMLA